MALISAENMEPQLYNNGDVIAETYYVFKGTVDGKFGALYEVLNVTKKELCFLKLETESQSSRMGIATEIEALKSLQHSRRFPRFVAADKVKEKMFGVSEFFAANLNEVRKSCPPKCFTFGTAVRLASHCLGAVEELHASGWLHRDIAPANFLLRPNGSPGNGMVCLSGLHFAKKFRSSTAPENVKISGFIGTIKYASLNAHKRRDQVANDDLYSLWYSVVELFKGDNLPWREERDESKVAVMKVSTDDQLLSALEKEIKQMYETIQKLPEKAEPSYHALKTCLYDVMIRKSISSISPYDWERRGAFRDVLKNVVSTASRSKEKEAILKKFAEQAPEKDDDSEASSVDEEPDDKE